VSHKYEVENAGGSLTEYQQEIVEQVAFHELAIQISVTFMIIMIGLRIAMERLTRKTKTV
jgi:hypothetical protein